MTLDVDALLTELHQRHRTRPGRGHHPPPARDHRDLFAALIDGPFAHIPSGSFAANSAGSGGPGSPTTCSAPPAPWPASPRRGSCAT